MNKIQIDEAKGWEVLDALTLINQADDDRDFLSGAECYAVDKAITVLREALAEQPAFVQIGNRPKEEDYTKLTSYIEALEIYVDRKELQWKAFEDYDCDAIDAMLAEKKELAQQSAQQKPVACANGCRGFVKHPSPANKPLTDEEIDRMTQGNNYPGTVQGARRFTRAIEAKLKEKNK